MNVWLKLTMDDFVYVFDAWRKWSCGVVCVWPRTNSVTIVSRFIWFCYLEWMSYGGMLIWCDPLTSKIYQVDRTILVSVRIFEPLYGYFRRREDHRGKNEDLKIEAKIGGTNVERRAQLRTEGFSLNGTDYNCQCLLKFLCYGVPQTCCFLCASWSLILAFLSSIISPLKFFDCDNQVGDGALQWVEAWETWEPFGSETTALAWLCGEGCDFFTNFWVTFV